MRFWRFLNSRLVSSLLAVVLFAALVFLAFVNIAWLLGGEVDYSDVNYAAKVRALQSMKVLSFSEVATPAGQPQRFIGRVKNSTDGLVTHIEGVVTFYDDNDKVVDLFTEQLDAVPLLEPGDEADFLIVRPNDCGRNEVEPLRTKALTVKLRFVDVVLQNP